MARLSDDQQAARRRHLLDAAERCFIREGFHRTSMQRICAEAGVSPGALYLYFPSKEALIAGLVERDRQEMAQGFAAVEDAADPLHALEMLARRHFVEEPADCAAMAVQIWAESTLDPEVAALCTSLENEVRGHLVRLMTRLPGAGSRFDPARLAELTVVVADGLFKQRALQPQQDPRPGCEMLIALIRDAMAGRLPLVAPTATTALPEEHAA